MTKTWGEIDTWLTKIDPLDLQSLLADLFYDLFGDENSLLFDLETKPTEQRAEEAMSTLKTAFDYPHLYEKE